MRVSFTSITFLCGLSMASTLFLSHSASAQSSESCTLTVANGSELKEPQVIAAKDGVLNTSFVVRRLEHCVPDTSQPAGSTTGIKMMLRTYGYPIDPSKPIDPDNPNDPNIAWTFPGPTMAVRKASGADQDNGDRVKIGLFNRMDPVSIESQHECNKACAAGDTSCQEPQREAPNCFHGDSTTNLHYHGTHISPQPHQDYVLLELYPKGSTLSEGGTMHSSHGGDPTESTAIGDYYYDIDPLPYNQADGTHWYHAHKHGATAVQMINGMSGALLIHGPFDDWLNRYYEGQLSEKLLVIQQIFHDVNFHNRFADFNRNSFLVNGQANPVITMSPGEVQRWRFVNATMHISSQVNTFFSGTTPPQFKQIAMDGVQFSPENYASQPLLGINSAKQPTLALSPGNRVDILIQAPAIEGDYILQQEISSDINLIREDIRLNLLKARVNNAKANNSSSPALLTVRVRNKENSRTSALSQAFPSPIQWPVLPPYLSRITDSEIVKRQQADYNMTNIRQLDVSFTINNKMYDPSCADFTMTLGTAEEWQVTNASGPQHPFHIHTNPFQLLEKGSIINGVAVPFVQYKDPIWQDTQALPALGSTWDVKAGPIWNNDEAKTICPNVCSNNHGGVWNDQWRTIEAGTESVCGCTYANSTGYVRIRHRFEDFTGAYVQHCHFLGHEDQGMMTNVQTVCPEGSTLQYGKARNGLPECVPGNFTPAIPKCPNS